MKDTSSPNHDSAGPKPWQIATAVFLTVLSGAVFFGLAISLADANYRQTHALADVEVSGFFSNSMEPAPVTLEMLGARTVLVLLGIAVGYSILLHPLIGRVVSRTIHFLTTLVDSVYRLEDEAAWSQWDPGSSLVAGAAWPVTMIAIPFLLVAIVIGHVYRALWRW
jgi:hypothetical protein